MNTLDYGRLGRGIWVRCFAAVGLANAAGAISVFVYYSYIVPAPSVAHTLRDQRLLLAIFVSYLALTAIIGPGVSLVVLRPTVRWIRGRRLPTPAEARRTLRAPLVLAVVSFVLWFLAAFLFALVSLAIGEPKSGALRVVTGTLLAGFVSVVVSYLTVERVFQPAFSVAFAAGAQPRTWGGIRARIGVFWFAATVIPLVEFLLLNIFVDTGQAQGPIIFLASMSLVVGAFLLWLIWRSVGTPLAKIRRAVDIISQGKLDVSLSVSDAGELGAVQAGINQMVQRLRERRDIEEAFGRHVGPDVAKRALEHGLGLGGDSVVASVLFIDIVGSTEMSTTRTPQELVRTLNSFFEVVVDVVEQNSGFVNKFEGDGALALFGALVPQEAHATNALKCARQLHAELVAKGLPDAGIGVSSGSMVAGGVGAASRLEFTVIGDPVNEASRLSEHAKGVAGSVLVSQATIASSDGESSHWRRFGEILLRGRLLPTEAFVTQEKSEPTLTADV